MTVLITGGGGYLGGRLARHYAGSTDLDVVVTMRPSLSAPPPDPRIRTVPTDLREPDPFAALDPTGITRIVHAAAATRFDIDRDTAHRSNVWATEAVVAFAHRCPRLESLTLLSTVYAAGLADGPIPEAPLPHEPPAGFANHYEQSKWTAERVVIEQGDGLPWRTVRLATVIADDASGAVTQHNAFHRTLDLWFHGLLPVLPGRAETPLYVISGRFAIEAVAAVAEPSHDGGVYHLTPDAPSSTALAEVIDLVTDEFDADPTYRRRRVDRPLLADQDSFELLAGAVGSFRASLAGQAVNALTPFARQLYSVKQFETGRQTAIRPDDPRHLITATCRWLVQTQWGRRHAVA